jgi:hypothetical protein
VRHCAKAVTWAVPTVEIAVGKSGGLVLQVEETVFLAEQLAVQVVRGGLPLSIQECYQLLSEASFPFDHYLAYAFLRRSGRTLIVLVRFCKVRFY